ncbi:MAG: type II toxin-antitoxin system RelB/DinJ family antitoxin [Alphaproteobacteria bacterium]|nr:type II toxin-antitoxin system RelB/DinJ family antitoxin [Alphaproteobacteria bacterium]
MLKTEVVHARVPPALKQSAEIILRRLGLSTADAFNMLLHQVVMHKGMPFEVRIPNKATKQALKDMKSGKNMKTRKSVKDLMKEIRSSD